MSTLLEAPPEMQQGREPVVVGAAGAARPRRIAVVGAGLGGAMAAIYMAKRGEQVVILEQRPDPRREDVAIASMNLGLSYRAKDALRHVGLLDEVLALAIPMHGRMIHDLSGGLRFQPYGKDENEVIHAVPRTAINRTLLEAAGRQPGVELRFETRCVHLDRDTATLTLRNENEGTEVEESFDLVIGADGINSRVRRWMQRGERADFQRSYLDWGWKELRIPAAEGGGFRMKREAFHLWPRGGSMLFAHPNPDGTFTCSLVLPFEGETSFASIRTVAEARAFFERSYPDLVELIPDLEEQFLERPMIDLVDVRTSLWHHRDKVVLLGDSAHGVVPFYAQGMNAAFEDCRVLDRCLEEYPGDLARAFARYQASRKPNTDALADLSRENFAELRDRVRSPWMRTRKAIHTFLHRILGERWMPLHAWVTHTLVPYAHARALARRQDRILAAAGVGFGVLLFFLLWNFFDPF